ncbi:response regulator transcription factor [Chryseobacterium populi]|uniref:Response regulator with CheY-like receiver domain and winged-helix DNA-binding domain n=1 Tax=Chryseobacterium populi TaxID=1144316 RepID=J3CQH3_9FLAO|nr:response regulator transcription factor [Chryseobacterium populi]EJL76191.1 response regulator with CheY-like receiver domain and winged-helix DNA-binding domain [Chryseobacterium populi]
MKHILLAEDDYDFADILKQYLELAGFKVSWSPDGLEALNFLRSTKADLCILDVMMPVMDGFTLASEIIQVFPEMPFIFLTARNQKEDKLKGLKLGADDYVVKPFEADELVLRIRNILKRNEPSVSKATPEIIPVGSYIFDYNNLLLRHKDTYIRLTEKEAMLLLYLTQNPNRIIKREEVLLQIWKSDDYFSGRSLDVFVSRLRKYLNADPRIEIETIRGMGFEFHLRN